MFWKIEAWLVLVLALLAVIGAILFGAVVLDQNRGNSHLGKKVGAAAVSVAEVPWSLLKLVQPDKSMTVFRPKNVAGKSGWSTVDEAAAAGPEGYVLLSRYDGNLKRPVVELRSLPDGKVLYEWKPDVETLLKDVPRPASAIADYTRWNLRRYRVIHPLLMDNGDLIIKDHQSALFRITPCGDAVWTQDEHLYHHSTQPDGAGGVWVPSYVEPSPIKKTGKLFKDDALARIGPDGKLLYFKSLTQIMIDNGLFYAIFGPGTKLDDPLHLNDIEPVLADGPYWRKGDLFLSLRHLSAIILFRPSTGKIVWMKRGPWMGQHDVDIIDDHTIGVFNNNAYNAGTGPYVRGISEVLYYDFATDSVSSPFRAGLEKIHTLSFYEGLFDLMPSGYLFM